MGAANSFGAGVGRLFLISNYVRHVGRSNTLAGVDAAGSGVVGEQVWLCLERQLSLYAEQKTVLLQLQVTARVTSSCTQHF